MLLITNDENFLWYRFKPELLSLKCIYNVRYAFDEYREPKIDYDLKKPYDQQMPRSFGFHDKGKIFAIMICDKGSINYILIKSHPLFKKVSDLIEKEFDFTKSN